jgi:Holliday junction resolvase
MSKYQIHQIDGNQRAIMDYLQAHGFSVTSIGRPLDLIAGKDGKTYLLEIKLPKAKLRPSQVKFLATWRGHAAVIRDLTDAKALIDRHQAGARG